MKFLLYILLIQFFACVHCSTDHINIGYQVTLAIPVPYIRDFTGRAFLIESTSQMVPKFRVALSVEPINEEYSCSLDVFLGDIKVWTSAHFSRFYTTDKCALQLTIDGDLELKGQNEQVGWRSATSGQGVQRLHLLETGNLVLVDELNLIKWQTFNFPTDIMVLGQRLDVETRLTAFPSNSTSFYSFEIQRDKIALYWNMDKWKYSYWQFKPSNNQNLTFVGLASKGLELFNDQHKKIAELQSERIEPLRFLALGNQTGNLRLYYYSTDKGKFEESFQTLNSTCDFPLACKPYGICTLSDECSCIRLITRGDESASGCSKGISKGICGRNDVEMFELQGVRNVMKSSYVKENISQKTCANLCIDECECVAALYTNLKECFLYGEVIGVKQVQRGSEMSKYMIKVLKGNGKGHNGKSSGLKKWVLVVIGVADGLVIFVALGGLVYYVIWKRRKNLSDSVNST